MIIRCNPLISFWHGFIEKIYMHVSGFELAGFPAPGKT
jgi:hypothetical protein